jgi:hypothetical protein
MAHAGQSLDIGRDLGLDESGTQIKVKRKPEASFTQSAIDAAPKGGPIPESGVAPEVDHKNFATLGVIILALLVILGGVYMWSHNQSAPEDPKVNRAVVDYDILNETNNQAATNSSESNNTIVDANNTTNATSNQPSANESIESQETNESTNTSVPIGSVASVEAPVTGSNKSVDNQLSDLLLAKLQE